MDNEPLSSEDADVKEIDIKILIHHRVIKTLSIVNMIMGVITFGIGVASLAISLIVKCQYHPEEPRYDRYGYTIVMTMSMVTTTPTTRMCSYYRTFSAPGVWCGLMYIATGIIGLFASRRRTISFVVALMTLIVVSNWVSLCGMVFSMASHFDKKYNQLNDYPLSLHVLSGMIMLICLIVFIIQWVEFGYICHAACCNGKKGYPKMKETNAYGYRRLDQSLPVSMNPVPAMQPTPKMNYSSHAMSYPLPLEMPPSGPDTVFLVKNQQVIGVLPQSLFGQHSANQWNIELR